MTGDRTDAIVRAPEPPWGYLIKERPGDAVKITRLAGSGVVVADLDLDPDP
nr:hypothetical protein [Propionibacterium sp.]